MVEWTEFERNTIQSIFANLNYEVTGAKALARCLVVYPWTQRYFANFGNLYNAAAIMGNPKVAAHGTVVLHGLDRAVKNMDNIKATYAELSVLHSEKLHVDPDNFKVRLLSPTFTTCMQSCVCVVEQSCDVMSLLDPQLLADCLTIVVAAQMGAAFTAEVQAAFQKFLAV
uniref:Globin domain-containing protein n=2 Tax=Denticeps clupeoides TaxID=299321 RepID=A0AAY4CJ46_9TELE